MFVARKSTPPTMSIAMFQGSGHLVCCLRKYPIVTFHIHLRCIATVLLTAIGSHASKLLVHMQVSALLSK